MSKSLAVDPLTNDLFLGTDGNLAQTRDLAAVLQAAQHAAQTQLGEMIYAVDQGVPNFDTIWNGAPNLSQFDAFLRRAILAVGGVRQVLEVDVRTERNTLNYRAVIQTVYGTAVLNG